MKKFLSLFLAVLTVCSLLAVFTSCSEKKNKEENKVITVGYTLSEPMNYLDKDGKTLIGFDTELATKVFENLGYKVIFKEIKWSNKYVDLESGTIDCIWNGFTANGQDDGKNREDIVDFSYRYMRNSQVIVIKNSTEIKTPADMKNKIGVAESGSAGISFAEKFKENGATVKGVTKQTDALLEVNAGSGDFAIVDERLAKTMCGKGDYKNLTILEGEGFSNDVEYYAIGFKKGSDLTAKVNEQLEALLKDGTIKSIGEKYGVAGVLITDYADQKKA